MNDKGFSEMAKRFHGDLNEVMDLYIAMIQVVSKAQSVQRSHGKNVRFYRVDGKARSIYITEKAAWNAVKVVRPDFTRREVRMALEYFRELGWIKKPIRNKGGVGEVDINGELCKVHSLKYGAANALAAFETVRKENRNANRSGNKKDD